MRPALAEASIEELFLQSGALREGHFLLKSGRHSGRYLEKFLVLQDPAATGELCAFWTARYRDADGAAMVDIVAGPTTGGIILAFETARQLRVRDIFAEEVSDPDGTSRREFRRGELICRQGEYASTAFYIISGSAEAYILSPDMVAEQKERGDKINNDAQ